MLWIETSNQSLQPIAGNVRKCRFGLRKPPFYPLRGALTSVIRPCEDESWVNVDETDNHFSTWYDQVMNLQRSAESSADLIAMPYPPQPIDFGLTYEETFNGLWLLQERRFRDETPDIGLSGLRYKEGDWIGFWSGGWWALLFFLPVYIVGFAIFAACNQIPGGWILGNSRAVLVFFLGMVFPGGILFGFSCAVVESIIKGHKRKHPSAAVMAYRQALHQYKLDLAAARKAREAEQELLRQKCSYWERLNGYEFERETAEVLKRHQFNPIVTRGSADGGVDIEVARHGRKGVVQCKAHAACIGPHTVRDLYGVIHHSRSDFGIIVSRGGFTRGAVEFAANKPIFLLDTSGLIAMQEGRDVLSGRC